MVLLLLLLSLDSHSTYLTHTIIHHLFADDLQLQMSAPPDKISELLHSMQSCISDVKAWATANMLKLNDSKTELMLVTSKRSKHLHNLPTSITIGNAQIPFKQWWWWWCRPHPVREHAQDLRPPLGARPASPPTRQAAQLPPRGPSTNPRPLV